MMTQADILRALAERETRRWNAEYMRGAVSESELLVYERETERQYFKAVGRASCDG